MKLGLSLGIHAARLISRTTLYLGGSGSTDATLTANWYSDEGLTTLAGRVPTATDIVELRGASRTITGGFTCYMLKLTQSSRTWTVNCNVTTYNRMLITGNNVAWNQDNTTFVGNIYCAGDNCSFAIDIQELIPGMFSYEDLYVIIAGNSSLSTGNTSGLLTVSGTSSGMTSYHGGNAIFSGQGARNDGEVSGDAIFSGVESDNGNYAANDAYFLGAFSINSGSVGSNAYVALGAGATGTGDIGGIVDGTTTYPYTPP